MKPMNDLIQRITNSIIRQEGMAKDFKNPGNLRAAHWLSRPVIKNNFWQPISRNQGTAGAAHVVALRIAMGQSLTELISAWAPPGDGNPTKTYIANVKAWANIPDENIPLYNYIEY
jgi:hypothetical protein